MPTFFLDIKYLYEIQDSQMLTPCNNKGKTEVYQTSFWHRHEFTGNSGTTCVKLYLAWVVHFRKCTYFEYDVIIESFTFHGKNNWKQITDTCTNIILWTKNFPTGPSRNMQTCCWNSKKLEKNLQFNQHCLKHVVIIV